MQNLISILIPNYNKALYLRETLESILEQTYINWECIIVDDHSTDHSWVILEEFAAKDARFKIYKRPNYLAKGGNNCRNYAFELSKGDFVNWFDSDDVMQPDFMEIKVDYLKNNDFDAVISKMSMFSSDLKKTTYKEWMPPFTNLKADYLLKDIQFVTSGPMIKRDFLIEKKLFFEGLKVGQDTEFFYRLVLDDIKIKIIDNILTFYRVSDDSILASFKNRGNCADAHYQTFLMIKNLVHKKSIPNSLNNFIKIKMVFFLKLLIKERKIALIIDWFWVVFLFLFYKRTNKYFSGMHKPNLL